MYCINCENKIKEHLFSRIQDLDRLVECVYKLGDIEQLRLISHSAIKKIISLIREEEKT